MLPISGFHKRVAEELIQPNKQLCLQNTKRDGAQIIFLFFIYF